MPAKSNIKKYFTAAQKSLASSSIVRYLGFDVLGFQSFLGLALLTSCGIPENKKVFTAILWLLGFEPRSPRPQRGILTTKLQPPHAKGGRILRYIIT